MNKILNEIKWIWGKENFRYIIVWCFILVLMITALTGVMVKLKL